MDIKTFNNNRMPISYPGLLALGGLSLIPSICFSQVAKDNRPNIIFILTDDQRWDALGYAGNEIIITPHMDKLAKDGVYFSNAFATTPISAASRASILTGLYERTHGYTFQKGKLKQPYVDISYPVLFKNNGYHTGFFGKLDVIIDNASDLFTEADFYDRNNQYKDHRGYFYKTINKDTVHLTEYTGYQARNFIQNAPKNKPFCLSICFSAPHAHDNSKEQYFWQDKSNKRYENIDIPEPKISSDSIFEKLPFEVKKGFNRLRWKWRFDTPEKYQNSVKGYYRMISEIDDEIGKIRQLLKENNLADNTIIIMMGDNGYFLGERQLAGKWLMYDLSIKIPLIIFDPRTNKSYDIDDMVTNIDIPMTMLSLASIPYPSNYQGIDLTPYIQLGYNKHKRESLLIEHLWEKPEIPSSEGIRSENWKYIRYRFIDAKEELYNLKEDPDEINNLAQDSKYNALLNNFRNDLKYKTQKYYNEKVVSDFTLPHEINPGF